MPVENNSKFEFLLTMLIRSSVVEWKGSFSYCNSYSLMAYINCLIFDFQVRMIYIAF